MTLYIESAPDTFTRWTGGTIDGILLPKPATVEANWSVPELEEVGLWRSSDMIAPAGDVPEGKVSTGQTVQRVEGVVKYVHTLADVSLASLKATRQAALAARRWQFEVAGFVWQRPDTDEFYFIATDETSQGKIGNELKAAENGIRREGDVWKCGDPLTGAIAYVALTDAEIVDIGNKARNRTSDGFNHEATLAAAIAAAGDQAAIEAIDIDAGWPQPLQ